MLLPMQVIRGMACQPLEGRPHYFKLTLTTSAGTYVKEFVNGDFGRTVPSVGSLLDCHAEIVQLDVVDVHLQLHG
jgi:tRNA pseudouridine synthase 10